jgi:hypothetical protein
VGWWLPPSFLETAGDNAIVLGGPSGKKNKPMRRMKAGTIWMPQGMRKAAVPWFGSLDPPSMPSAAPNWMKYWL